MKNIDLEKSNSNQPPQIYICLVVSLSPQWLFKEKKSQMADHSHLFFFNNLSPNPKPSHGRPFTAHLRRSNTTSDGGSQAQTSLSSESLS